MLLQVGSAHLYAPELRKLHLWARDMPAVGVLALLLAYDLLRCPSVRISLRKASRCAQGRVAPNTKSAAHSIIVLCRCTRKFNDEICERCCSHKQHVEPLLVGVLSRQ